MSKKGNRIPIRSIIVALVVLSVAFYFIKICYEGLGQDFVEEGWRPTKGVVLSQDIALKGKKNIERKNQGIEQVINYEYTVEERTYKSNSVSKDQTVNANDYPQGKVIDVYYNPRNVSETVLLRTKVQKQYLYGMMAFCLIVVGVVLFSLVQDFKSAQK